MTDSYVILANTAELTITKRIIFFFEIMGNTQQKQTPQAIVTRTDDGSCCSYRVSARILRRMLKMPGQPQKSTSWRALAKDVDIQEVDRLLQSDDDDTPGPSKHLIHLI